MSTQPKFGNPNTADFIRSPDCYIKTGMIPTACHLTSIPWSY